MGYKTYYGYETRPYKREYYHQKGGDIWLPKYDTKYKEWKETNAKAKFAKYSTYQQEQMMRQDQFNLGLRDY